MLYQCIIAAAAKSLQSCLTLCDPIEGSPPGSPDYMHYYIKIFYMFGVYASKNVLCMKTFFQIIFFCILLQYIEYNSLRCKVNPCCLSILCMVV